MRSDISDIAPAIERSPGQGPLVEPTESIEPNAFRARPAQLLLGSIWFGLLAGWGEIGLRAVQVLVLGQRTFLGPDAIWMAPLADVCLFSGLGLLLATAAVVWRRARGLKLAGFVWAFAAIIGPLSSYPRLHTYAALALAAGIGVTVARVISAKSAYFWTIVRKSTVPLGVGIVLIAAVVLASRAFNEQSTIRALPAAQPGAPNVLLIVLDTVRAQNLSLYGHVKPTTPELVQFASRGVVFEQAISTSPWTLPSHASMFTGRYPHELTANWQTPLDDARPTLAEALRDRGYLTAGFAANLLYCTRSNGLSQGFAHYEDYPISLSMAAKSSWLVGAATRLLRRGLGERQRLVRKSAEDVNNALLSWLDEQGTRPWFVFLNYMDAHVPYLPPEPYRTRFNAKNERGLGMTGNPAHWPKSEFEQLENAYDASLAYLDHHLGLLFDELERRGALENTLVIVTADHGEQFGEHGLIDHANSLYRPLLHVPLMLAFPGQVPAGRRISQPVTLRDLPRSVLDLVGVRTAPEIPGRSWRGHWGAPSGGGKPSPLLSSIRRGIRLDAWLPASKGDMQSLVALGMHYIVGGDGTEELYDYKRDPGEERNLVQSATGKRMLMRLRKQLKQAVGDVDG